jgi:ubiquinone/menaquinone biosynthesis C-methylase UbiE
MEKAIEIQKYWEERAGQNADSPKATTDDVCLRDLEIKTFISAILKSGKKKGNVLDVGCGDGYTTLRIASKLKDFLFTGMDYSEGMILNAQKASEMLPPAVKKRVNFKQGDATRLSEIFPKKSFDIILSDRCLINLISAKAQYAAIHQISDLLKKGGYYISIENFIDGNENLNKMRKSVGLQPIPVRWHNLFFKQKEYLEKTKKYFSKVEIIDFSSSYYFATRVVYSKYCQLLNVQPDYLHEIHKLSVDLDSFGAFSPIKLTIHKK